MTRNTRKNLRFTAAVAVVAAVGYFIDPFALAAMPVLLGTVAGDDDGDGDDGGGDAGDAGGGDAHDYDLPPTVGGGADGDDDPDPDAADPDDDPDAATGTRGRSAGERRPGDNQMVPAYRLQAQQARFEKLLREESTKTQSLLAGLRQALGGGNGAGPEKKALSPQQEKLRGQFLELFPEFADLLKVAPKAGDLLGLADEAPRQAQEVQTYWANVARTTSTRLFSHAAKELGLKKLDADDQSVVRDSFISWVKADQSGDRNHRYEGQDSSLIDDFWTWYQGRFRQPAQRAGNAGVLRRAQQARPLPRGGNASTQVPPLARKKGAEDDDPFEAANTRAWQTLSDADNASR